MKGSWAFSNILHFQIFSFNQFYIMWLYVSSCWFSVLSSATTHFYTCVHLWGLLILENQCSQIFWFHFLIKKKMIFGHWCYFFSCLISSFLLWRNGAFRNWQLCSRRLQCDQETVHLICLTYLLAVLGWRWLGTCL